MPTRVQFGSWTLPYWLAVGAAALAYFALAKLGLTLASINPAASPVWPAAGLAVALIRVFGLRLWPAIALGALAANALVVGLPTALPISAGNTLEGIVGGLIVNHILTRYSDSVLPARTVGTGLAAALATLISATCGVASLFVSGRLPGELVGETWFTWWAGDALGILVVTPALLAFRGAYRSDISRQKAILGGGLVLASVAAVLALVWPDGAFSIAVFLAFPVVLAAGTWLGARAYGWTTFALAAGLIAETMLDAGPFHAATLNDALLNMQMFTAVLAIATLMLVDLRALDRRIPAIVLLLGSLAAAGAFAMERRDSQRLDGKRFEALVVDATDRINERMAIYANAMRGGASLFAANPNVSNKAWHDFTASLALERRYPGILGVGFIVPLKPEDLDRFIADRRRDGTPDFTVRKVANVFDPRLPGDELFIITYIEPVTTNAAAIGVDIASETVRRDGAMVARDTGEPTATGRIRLVQDPRQRPGFLFYVPVYDGAVDPGNVADRRRAFRGWVYAPIVSEDLFRPALTGFDDQVAFTVFDGMSTAPGDLIANSHGAFVSQSDLRLERTLDLVGRTFTVIWTPGPRFVASRSRDGELYSCAIMLLAILLAALIANLQSLRLRATTLADRMTEALQASTRRLELVIASNNDGIWDIDVKTGTFWTSPRCAEMLGYTQAELPNEREAWRAVMVPEDRGLFAAQLADLLTGLGERIEVVQHYTHKQGHVVAIQDRGIVVKGPDGAIERVVGTLTDITQLLEAERRLLIAIDSIDSGFALFDAQDRLILHNKGFLGRDVIELIGSDPRGRTFEELIRAFTYGRVTPVAALLDREAWIRERVALHRNPTGPFDQQLTDGQWVRIAERRTADGGYVGTWTDITELKRAEATLHDAIESINEGFVLLDAEQRVVVVNRHFREMHPFSGKVALPGTPVADVIRYGAQHGEYAHIQTPGQIEALVEERVNFYQSGEGFTGERELPDGRWLLVSLHPTSTGGCVSIRTDITQQKNREAELQTAKEALEKRSEDLVRLTDELHRARRAADLANLSKSQFLANMAHELRTPLNAINGYSELILTGLYGPLQPEKYTEFVNHIHKGGEHLLSLINDILDLSKVEAGKLDLQVEALSSAQVAHSVIETVRPIAGARGVELRTEVAKDCPILHADTRAVRQILLNLLSNAVKFTPAAGSVTLEMARNNGAGITISVVDTGIGMTPEQTVKALELYGQVQTDLTKKHAGTGLGLPLVKALAERHGGTLSLISEKDKGTTATVFLPWRSGLPTDLN